MRRCGLWCVLAHADRQGERGDGPQRAPPGPYLHTGHHRGRGTKIRLYRRRGGRRMCVIAHADRGPRATRAPPGPYLGHTELDPVCGEGESAREALEKRRRWRENDSSMHAEVEGPIFVLQPGRARTPTQPPK